MKQTIITIILALACLTGQAQENNYTIKGKIDNTDIKVVYLEQEGKAYETLDSAVVTNGEFTMKGKVGEPVPAVILTKGRVPLYMFILEPGDITFKSQVFAVGSVLNDSLTHLYEYSHSSDDTVDKDAKEKRFEQYAEAMFLRHKNDALGLKILSMCFSNADSRQMENLKRDKLADTSARANLPNMYSVRDLQIQSSSRRSRGEGKTLSIKENASSHRA